MQPTIEKDLPLFPEAASTIADKVDGLYFYLIGVSAVFSVGIALAIVYLSIRYRRGSGRPHRPMMKADNRLEITWIVIPFLLAMVMFIWGARVYYDNQRMPADTLDIYVVGKQWMWKIQHPQGRREINELHIPINQPVKLIMTSQDVIHSFFIPAFRIKQDVLPGRYTQMWFEALRPGEYHLFCAEYCGTSHSEMVGKVVAMEPHDYQEWLQQGPQTAVATRGEQLFERMRCAECHRETGDVARGPSLVGLLGSTVQLADGTTVTADEEYFRESVLEPNAKVVAGYEAIMPTYAGLLTSEDIQDLLAHVKALGAAPDEGEEAPR